MKRTVQGRHITQESPWKCLSTAVRPADVKTSKPMGRRRRTRHHNPVIQSTKAVIPSETGYQCDDAISMPVALVTTGPGDDNDKEDEEEEKTPEQDAVSVDAAQHREPSTTVSTPVDPPEPPVEHRPLDDPHASTPSTPDPLESILVACVGTPSNDRTSAAHVSIGTSSCKNRAATTSADDNAATPADDPDDIQTHVVAASQTANLDNVQVTVMAADILTIEEHAVHSSSSEDGNSDVVELGEPCTPQFAGKKKRVPLDKLRSALKRLSCSR